MTTRRQSATPSSAGPLPKARGMKTRGWIAALTGGTLVVAAGLVGATSLTSASATTSTTPTPGSGQIVLATNVGSSAAGFVYWVPSGSVIDATTLTQNLTTTANNGCIMASPTGATPAVLNFTANGTSQVGYQPGSNGGSIGVSSKGGNATSCTQVNQKEKESLTIDLNVPSTSLPSTTPVQAVGVTFDIEAKGNVIVTASLTSQGNAAGTFTLYSGKSQKATLAAGEANCNVVTVADSGPDAGSGDNCPWTIKPTKSFDKIVLTSTTPAGGAFSVEGGGDWTDASNHRTVFDVITNATGILNCNATTESSSTTVSGNVTTAQVTRAANGPVSGVVPDCSLIPYALGTADGTATFHKPLTSQATAQFSVNFSRTVATNTNALLGNTTSPLTVVGAVAPLKIDWEDGNSNVLTYCPAGLFTGVVAGFPTFDYTKVPGDLDPTADGTQYACKYAETQSLDSTTGNLTVQNLVYLTGDAKFLT